MTIARLKEQLHKHKTQEQLLIIARQKEEKLSQEVNLLKEELLQATKGHTPVSSYVILPYAYSKIFNVRKYQVVT